MRHTAKYKPSLGEGIYTIPDASRILRHPQPSLRRWIDGYWKTVQAARRERVAGILDFGIWGRGRSRAFNFYSLIELYTIISLKEQGVSFQKVRRAREELAERFGTRYPFASHKLMSDGRQILVEFFEGHVRALLELDTQGQMALEQIIRPFCKNLEFDFQTNLAHLYRPLGKGTSVIISPHHSFGRPTIEGTNIAAETIYDLVLAGEDKELIADLYNITPANIEHVISFQEAA